MASPEASSGQSASLVSSSVVLGSLLWVVHPVLGRSQSSRWRGPSRLAGVATVQKVVQVVLQKAVKSAQQY